MIERGGGSPVFDEVAGEVRLRVAVALADEVQVQVAGPLLSQGEDHRMHATGEVAVLGDDGEGGRVESLETLHAEQRLDDRGVDGAADPEEHVVSVLQQEDARGRQALVREIEDGGETDVIWSGGGDVVLVGVVRGDADVVAHVVDGEHARIDEDLGLLDVHVRQQLLEESSLIHTDIAASSEDQGLLQGHRVQRQQQQRRRYLSGGGRVGLLDGRAVLTGHAHGVGCRLLRGAQHLDGGLVHSLPGIVHAGLLGDVHPLLGQQVHGAIDVQRLDHLRGRLTEGKSDQEKNENGGRGLPW